MGIKTFGLAREQVAKLAPFCNYVYEMPIPNTQETKIYR